jgi:hypothetical protein
VTDAGPSKDALRSGPGTHSSPSAAIGEQC